MCALYNYTDFFLSLQENQYYRTYLELILTTENFDVFFKLYNKLVPHVAIPEPALMQVIIETLQYQPVEVVTQYIPKIWSHMILFGHLDREVLLERILNLISVHCKPTPDSPLNAQFAEMALVIWDHIQVIKLFYLILKDVSHRHAFQLYQFPNQYISGTCYIF